MRARARQNGFALVLVLALVAVGVVLSLSYLSAAALHAEASHNFRSMTRARYLAESGVHHALFLLRVDPSELEGGADRPAGPFYADASSDGYVLWCEPVAGQPWQYVLRSTATSGGARVTVSATVACGPGPMVQLDGGLLVGGGSASLPGGLTVHGDLHVNGSLVNLAQIDGDVSATEGVSDPQGRIRGEIDGQADAVTAPDIRPEQYLQYGLGGTACQAAEVTLSVLDYGNPLCGGSAVTRENRAGVVHLRPQFGDVVKINSNVEFTGTLIIDGGLVLDGHDIKLTSVDGFPAVVATGPIYVSKHAQDVEIDGVVVTGGGFVPEGDQVSRSSTTVRGAVVAGESGYRSDLAGSHTLHYDPQRSGLFDLSGPVGPSSSGAATVEILEWHD